MCLPEVTQQVKAPGLELEPQCLYANPGFLSLSYSVSSPSSPRLTTPHQKPWILSHPIKARAQCMWWTGSSHVQWE